MANGMKKHDAEKFVLGKDKKGDADRQLLSRMREYMVNFYFPEIDDDKPCIQITDASFR